MVKKLGKVAPPGLRAICSNCGILYQTEGADVDISPVPNQEGRWFYRCIDCGATVYFSLTRDKPEMGPIPGIPRYCQGTGCKEELKELNNITTGIHFVKKPGQSQEEEIAVCSDCANEMKEQGWVIAATVKEG